MRIRKMKARDPEQWHKWWAWYAVPMPSEDYTEVLVWLEYVERRLDTDTGWKWEYREVTV